MPRRVRPPAGARNSRTHVKIRKKNVMWLNRPGSIFLGKIQCLYVNLPMNYKDFKTG